MAEKSLFFNARPDSTSVTGYDRNYNADDISDWLGIIWETGVVKSDTVNNEPTGLKVVANSGMTINVNAGKAAIKGKAYINNSFKSFTISTAPTGANARYDLVVLKYDNNVSKRTIGLELRTGQTFSSTPTDAQLLNQLTRNENVHELLIGYIKVEPSADEITQANIIDTRSDETLCGWFTAVKGYEDYYDAIIQPFESDITISAATTTVITTLASSLYNSRYSLIEVYTNGIKEQKSAYTVSTSGNFIVITFAAQKAAGSKITVKLENFIDGEGFSTAINEYNKLLADVASLNAAGEYDYICNGVNDNILISNIVKSFYSVNDYKNMKLNIIGTIGMSAPVTGDGTVANPYSWFNFAKQINTNRVITVDFSNCSEINPLITDGTYNVIFRGEIMTIERANIIANNTALNTVIRVFNSTGSIRAENCRFWLTGYKDSLISLSGTFTNCRGSVANVINNSYCFLPASNGMVKIIGGEYYAYTGDANVQSAIVGQSGAEAVSILYGVSAPTSARTGYYQTNSILQWVGGGILSCTDLISELPMIVVSGISNIRGTIAKSKTNVW